MVEPGLFSPGPCACCSQAASLKGTEEVIPCILAAVQPQKRRRFSRCSAFVIGTVTALHFSQFNITVQPPSTRPANLSHSGIYVSWWLVTLIHMGQWMGTSLSWAGGRALALSFGESLRVILPRNLSCSFFSFITLKSAFKYPGNLFIYCN